jgi:hypothetical protein
MSEIASFSVKRNFTHIIGPINSVIFLCPLVGFAIHHVIGHIIVLTLEVLWFVLVISLFVWMLRHRKDELLVHLHPEAIQVVTPTQIKRYPVERIKGIRMYDTLAVNLTIHLKEPNRSLCYTVDFNQRWEIAALLRTYARERNFPFSDS